MSLQFILGNSGSGKTEYMYQKVVELAEANPYQNYLVLVPEQFTMQTQRKLVDLSTNHAILNIDVLSFQRLALRVFDEMGISSLQILEETGKSLVLRKVAQEQEGKLTVLKGNMHRMGYIGEVKSLISELMQYNITPERLAECMKDDRFSHALSAKLSDVYVMYQSFCDYLVSGNFQSVQSKQNKVQVNDEKGISASRTSTIRKKKNTYITAEELLHVLADLAPDSKMLKDSVLVLDEFTGFTPVQVELLQKLMPLVREVWVSLRIDAKENFYHSKGIQELFDMPKKTIRTLMDLAQKTHTEVFEPIVITGGEKKRFKDAPALYFMEQNLFRSSYKRMFGETKEIQILSLKNPKEELTWAARKINDLVQNQGYRYREIAVVSGDVEVYGNYVEQVCKKYQIPYFLDTTREVLFHPFIEFVRAILELMRNDFSYNSVMRLLRTGYCGIVQEDVDKMENYLLATGIRGRKKWMGRWIRLPKNEKAYDIELLEGLRKKFMEDLEPVITVFSKKSTVEEQIKALYLYIVTLDVEQQLFVREKELLQADEQTKSKEYEQIYQIVMDLFEKCIRVLGKEQLSVQELGEILDAGFESAKVAVIPPGYDSVTIGDIERTRLNHVKVLLFLGVNEGIVPKSVNQGGIISQYERDSLEEADIVLAPCAREKAFMQKFYLYLNMTKPSHQLYLTYGRIDSEGKALRPSYLIRTMQRMFPDMKIQEVDEVDRILDTSTKEAANDYLLTGNRTPEWYALAKCFLESEDEWIRNRSKAILDAFYYRYAPDPISHVIAEAIYGKNIEGSVTRLEKFAKCAYSHFLSYGLKLREREESGFQSMDMGNLYHTAVELYSKRLAESEYNWFNVPEETRDAYAVASMEEAVLAYPNVGIYATAENAYMVERMNHIFKQTIWALTTQVRKGRFVPNDFEISFSKADNLDALRFDLGNNNRIQLTGRIDRLDTCADDNRLYVKVIDYKSGNTKFDLLQLYHGLQLQLVVYMNAAMELEKKKELKKRQDILGDETEVISGKEIIPGGLFYYHIDDPVIEVTGDLREAEVQEAVLKELKPDGIVNKEEAVYRAMDDEFEQKSDVIPIQIKKDGTLSALSKVASTEEFAILSEYVNHSIVKTGEMIYEGDVTVAPYTDGQTMSCDYCPYSSICGFDYKIDGFKEKREQKIDKKDIFGQMEKDNAISRARKNK